jgi:hypothetical protein
MARKSTTQAAAAAAGQKIEEFAEDLGRIFGQAESKAAAWMNQRTTILDQLTQVRDKASGLIASLTGGNTAPRTRGRARGRAGKAGKRTVKLSAAGRAAISAAQKLRWAKYNAAKTKK